MFDAAPDLRNLVVYAVSIKLQKMNSFRMTDVTVCPRSSDPFYLVTIILSSIQWVTTSWTDGIWEDGILYIFSIPFCCMSKKSISFYIVSYSTIQSNQDFSDIQYAANSFQILS